MYEIKFITFCWIWIIGITTNNLIEKQRSKLKYNWERKKGKSIGKLKVSWASKDLKDLFKNIFDIMSVLINWIFNETILKEKVWIWN